jgi:hypothetical protein
MIKDRILLSALIFSVIWHLFWLSALTVVIVPRDARPPKFSSVSFLGPILEQSAFRVSSAAHERTAPENRYLSGVMSSSAIAGQRQGPDCYAEAGLNAGADMPEPEGGVTGLAIPAIDGEKIEPGNSQ